MYVCIDYLCICTGGLYSDLCFVYYHDWLKGRLYQSYAVKE